MGILQKQLVKNKITDVMGFFWGEGGYMFLNLAIFKIYFKYIKKIF